MKKIIFAIIIIFIIIIGVLGILKWNEINKTKYEIEEITDYKYFLLYKENKMGVIDTNGKILVEPIYDSIQIPNPSKEVFICLYDYNSQTEEYKTKVLNEQNEEILTGYSEITAISLDGIASDIPYEKSALIYKENDKYGIIDFNGKKLTKAIYDEIHGLTYKEGELLVKENDKYGVINTKGAVIIKSEYNSITADNYYNKESKYELSGYIIGIKEGESYQYGYINNKGKILLKPEYTSITRLNNVKDEKNIYLIAQNKTKTGLVKNKETIIDFEYKELNYNEDYNVIISRKNAKSGIFNLQGKEILPTKFDNLYIKGEYIYTKNEDEEKFFDINGNELSELNYKSVSKENNGKFYIIIDENSSYGILDENKNPLINENYSYIEYLYDDYFIVHKDKLGIINSKGEIKVDFKYDVLSKVGDSKIVQAKDIDKDTIDLYSSKLENLGTYKNAIINQREEYIELNYADNTIYYDFNGKELKNTEILKQNKLFSIKSNDKWGFKDKNENIVVECIYDEVTEFNEYGFAGVKLNGKWGVINQDNKVVLEPTYELKEMISKPYFIDKYYRVYYGYGSVYYTVEN